MLAFLKDVRVVGGLWLLVRLFLGYEWLKGGIAKLGDPAWVGGEAGAAVWDVCAPELLRSGWGRTRPYKRRLPHGALRDLGHHPRLQPRRDRPLRRQLAPQGVY